MYHLRLKGSHYEMGTKRGNIFKKCNVVFPLKLDDFQIKHGIESEKILRKYFSEVCDEVKGITDTLHINYDYFMSWMLAMGCCMYNLDTNIPLVRGCTAFGVMINNKTYYGRNNDLPPYLKDGSKSEIYTLSDNKFNITTSSFINGEEGMNKYGLVVGMTFVYTRLLDIKPGFNSVFAVRYLLEKAKNVKEAVKLLSSIPIASNYNIILVDNSDMVLVECSPKEINIINPTSLDNGVKVICTVNSFLTPNMKKYEPKEETYYSSERYNTVINAFKNYSNEEVLEYIKDILKGKLGFMCQYKKSLNFETVWSSIFVSAELKIYRSEGDPRRKKFTIDNRMQK